MKFGTFIRNVLLFGIVLTLIGCSGNEQTMNNNDIEPEHSLEEIGDDDNVTEDIPQKSKDTEVNESVDYTRKYKRVLEGYIRLICTGGEEEFEGSSGVKEAVVNLGIEETLKNVGYTIQDISGDGIPELLIGEISEEDTNFGTMIYALYHCVNDVPECTFEGWYRNAYHWMGDGCFTYNGSGGAMYSMFGITKLTEDGTALEWQDYYFTQEKNENMEEIGLYHNKTGIDDKAVSEEMEISMDEFWEIQEQISKKKQWMELKPFSEAEGIELPDINLNDESDLERVRKQIDENGDVCAVGYLGYFDGTFEDLDVYFHYLEIAEDFDFLLDIDEEHFIDQEGFELYLVVPAPDTSSLVVNEYLLSEYEPVEAGPGDELGRFIDGSPVLMRGNISEVVPNLYFEAENPNGEFIGYNPSLSQRDGSLNSVNGICDLTPYKILGIVKEPIEGAEYTGIWTVMQPDHYEHILYLNGNGECSYGIVDAEATVVVTYSGWWEMAGGELNIALWEDYESLEPAVFGTYIPELLPDGNLYLELSF